MKPAGPRASIGAAGAEAAEFLFVSHAVSTPCPQTGCSTSSVALYADGRLVTESNNPTTHSETTLTAERLAEVRGWLRENRAWLLDPVPGPAPNDLVEACVVVIDGVHAELRNGSVCDRISIYLRAP